MNYYLTDGLDEVILSRPGASIIVRGEFNKMHFNPLCRRFNLRKCVHAPTRIPNVVDKSLQTLAQCTLTSHTYRLCEIQTTNGY